MASQVTSTGGTAAADLEVLEIRSHIRGYHAYMGIWNPVQGQTLLVKRELTKAKDKNAVGVFLEDVVVGHVPHNLAPRLSQFLRRDVNKAFVEVTGQKINRGAGYGLEVPCVYRLYGPKVYVERINELVNSLRRAGLQNNRFPMKKLVVKWILTVQLQKLQTSRMQYNHSMMFSSF